MERLLSWLFAKTLQKANKFWDLLDSLRDI